MKICGLIQEIESYKFGSGTKANVIIAVPLYIQNGNGERIFLGFPEQNKNTASQQYDEHCILDRICSKMKRIPSQFILGYIIENQERKNIFIKNEKHYSNLVAKDREVLFDEMYSNMDDISKSYNELIINENIEQIKHIKESTQKIGWKSLLINNVLLLAQKYKGKQFYQDKRIRTEKHNIQEKSNELAKEESLDSSSQSKTNVRKVIISDDKVPKVGTLNSTSQSKTNVRRVIISDDKVPKGGTLDSTSQFKTNVRRVIISDDKTPKEKPLDSSSQSKTNRVQSILLDLCKETKLSDLYIAKQMLKEGIEKPEKDDKGKEI